MKLFTIDKQSAGRRLFRYIKVVLPDAKNGEIFKMLRKKVITVNGKKVEGDYLLKEGDELKFFLRDDNFKAPKKSKFRAVKVKLDIVYEDTNLIVVSKAPGMVVHAGNGDYKESLIEGIKAYLYRKGEYDPASQFTPALCNRLDRNTSGLVVAAKNHQALKDITSRFRERRTVKRYLAVVSGAFKAKALLISLIDDSPNSENKVTVTDLKTISDIPEKELFCKDNPQLSATLVTPLKVGRGNSLVEVELWTGKKHQIRAQLRAAGFPLIGDRKYFTSSSNSQENRKLPRYFLHAWKLKLEGYEWWEAALPADMQSLLERLFNYSF